MFCADPVVTDSLLFKEGTAELRVRKVHQNSSFGIIFNCARDWELLAKLTDTLNVILVRNTVTSH